MKTSIIYGAVLTAMALTLPACAVQDQAIRDDDMGLSKTSVYDVPTPDLIEWPDASPGRTQERVERSYASAPPMIPHRVEGLVPITQNSNKCKGCHARADLVGKPPQPNKPVPVPASHLADVQAGELHMGRWVCTQCHSAQANVDVLVDSTFDN